MEKYFLKTSHKSEIHEKIFSLKDHFDWYTGRKNDQFQVKNLSQSYILKDKFLSYISKEIPGTIKLFKFPPGCMYRWHKDGNNIFNFNLTFKKQKSIVFFQNDDYDPTNFHPALQPIVHLEYEPEFWYLFNANMSHCIFNYDNDWRYLLTYTVPRITEISYSKALNIVKEFIRLNQ
jgi:hypothetical protein